MAGILFPIHTSNRAYRLAVGCLFFLQGICFASWASRIPSIQQSLSLSDASLGLVLFALPVGSMLGLPLAGWLVTRFGSKRVAANALLLYSFMLICLGLSNQVYLLVTSLVLFGLCGNVSNIAINTQAVGVEARYGRSIMGSFHGLWSLAGFAAAGIGTIMIGHSILPFRHFLMVTVFVLVALGLCISYLIPHEQHPPGTPVFVRPDRTLMTLGFVAFCCMMCEGAMFDWSGIYFRKVVHADKDWIGAGYTAFMCTMATGRFLADRVSSRLGFKGTLQLSGLLIVTGLLTAVIFPYLFTGIIGFFIVGFGVSSVVPLVYSEAGRSRHMSAGMALAAVSSIGFLGFLAGPPLIGVVAGLFSLRISLLIISIIGLTVALIARRIKV